MPIPICFATFFLHWYEQALEGLRRHPTQRSILGLARKSGNGAMLEGPVLSVPLTMIFFNGWS